mgnify:CR=1 FL=1
MPIFCESSKKKETFLCIHFQYMDIYVEIFYTAKGISESEFVEKSIK